MGIGVSVNIDAYEFEVEVAKQVGKEFYLFMQARNSFYKIQSNIERTLEVAIRSSSEYASLMNGELREHFGIVDASPALEDIITAVKQSMKLDIKPGRGTGGDLTIGTLTLSFFADDFARIYAVAVKSGSYISINRRGRQTLVPWLEWLLFGGDKVLIIDHEINLEPHKGSRTGPIMIKPRRTARGWRVPSQFSGRLEENWLTRSVEGVLPEIQASIITYLSSL